MLRRSVIEKPPGGLPRERKERVIVFMIPKCLRGVVLGISGIDNAAGTGMVITEGEPQAMITTH